MERLFAMLQAPFINDQLKRLGGNAAPDVIRLVLEHGNAVTDEQIANELGVKVTVVRAVFNRLHFWGIMDYDRTRDEETGWYTYTWHFLPEKLFEKLVEELQQEIDDIKTKIKELENVMLFECKSGHVRVPFEVAMEYGFRCPECGEELVPVDTAAKKRELKKRLEELRRLKQRIVTFLRHST